MKSALLVVGLVIGTLACSEQSGQFFPVGTFSDLRAQDADIAAEYSKHLTALGEASLWVATKDSRRESYRLLWLRSWDRPISVRIDKGEHGKASLTLKITTGHGGYEPGQLDLVRTKELSKEEFEAITADFRTSGFWTMAATEESGGSDGAQWILEAAHDGHYHLVDRWSPKEGAIRDLALHILQLSGYTVAKGKVY